MTRPEVTPTNFRAVYDFYRQYNPNPTAAKLGYWALAMSVGPKISTAPGASDAITQHLSEGGRLVVAANHTSEWDIPSIASLASRVKAMRPLRANTFIPTKSALSKNRFLRRAVDTMGQLPTFRVKDSVDKQVNIIDPSSAELKDALITTSSALISRGKHMAIFPEGERNKEDPGIVQPLKDGILRIIEGIHPVHSLAILPVGIHHDPEATGRLYFRHPTMHIGQLMAEPFNSNTLLGDMRSEIQSCVDEARAL